MLFPEVIRDDGDAGEDVLSLCDMPLYGDSAEHSFSSEDSSSSRGGDEFFEFSPQDGADRPGHSLSWDSPRDVVFCGRLIQSAPLPSSPYRTGRALKRNQTGVVKRARVMGYSSAKCDKWYMMAFGLARFPSEMALSEIRRRQGKGKGDIGGANGHQSASEEMVVSGKKEGGKVWGMMMKSFGCCRKEQVVVAGAVVKAFFGCIPRL